MPARHKSRRQALQILFQSDLRGQPVEEAMAAYYGSLHSESAEEAVLPDPFTEQLVKGTMERISEIDRLISEHSQGWRVERMPVVDRNILRLAIYEMTQTPTPAVVVIDEALELGRRFSGEESLRFINGLLDAVRRRMLPEQPSPEREPQAGA
jgi:N utilization substance protein B